MDKMCRVIVVLLVRKSFVQMIWSDTIYGWVCIVYVPCMPNGITKRNILTHASFFVRDPAYINKKGGLVTQLGAHEITRSKKVNVN